MKNRDSKGDTVNRKGSLAVIYSRANVRCTTIGVTAFHFCVRNGNRWYYSTMAARQIG